MRVRFVTDMRLFRLEYGEAHVAIRAGSKPQEPDNVVQPLVFHDVALYASKGYADRVGLPKSEADLPRHRFIGHENIESRAPFFRWLASLVPHEAFVFRTNDNEAQLDAVKGGVGLGFLSVLAARDIPDLVEVMSPRQEWQSPLWLVTHVDLHRTPKVQAFLSALKEDAQRCNAPQGA
jgi:DNA-binding transcriptional LysR family regulator